jgi:hypothetical protein
MLNLPDTLNVLTVARYKRTRFWEVREPDGSLLCVCVYLKGARAVQQRLARNGQQKGKPRRGQRTEKGQ